MNPWPIHLGATTRSLEDVKAIHALGLQFGEVTITRAETFLPLLEGFKALKKDLGLYYLCHGPREGDPNDLNHLENAYLPRVVEILSVMPKLDMRLLTVHLWVDARFMSQVAIDHKISMLQRLLNRAADMGITLCLENLSERADHLKRLFDALPLLSLTLDLGHGQLLSQENTGLEIIRQYPDRISHVHIHDNRGGNSPEDDLHLPVGEGTIPFPAIFQSLFRCGYQRTMTLELRPHEIAQCLGHVKGLIRTASESPGAP